MTAFIERVTQAAVGPGSLSASTTLANPVTYRQGSILVTVGYGNNAGNSVSSVADNVGNTYVKDYAIPSGATGNRGLEIWRCQDPAAMLTSNQITITMASSVTQGLSFIADLFSRLGSPDVTSYGYQATSFTSATAGLTPNPGDALAYAAVIANSSEASITVAAPFTNTGSLASSGVAAMTSYDDSPPSPVTATWTLATAHTSVSAMVTYPLAPITSNKGAFFVFMGM